MDFSMNVMDEEVVEEIKTEIIKEDKPTTEETAKLQTLASTNTTSLMSLNLDDFKEKQSAIKMIDNFGLDTMKSSERSNKLLQTSVVSMSAHGGEGSSVGNNLLDLQKVVKDLDPSGLDFAKQGLLGKVFNPVRGYFSKYQKSEDVIESIIVSLNKGQDTLKNDNITLGVEQQNMRTITKKLNKEIELGMQMDECLSTAIAQAEANGESVEKIKFINEEVLFPLRQRLMDMQQVIVINQQGVLATEILVRNNKELIRGVERAKNVTVSALRIACMVASALYNQKIVLDKINALNETTNNIVSSVSKMLSTQGAEINKMAVESNLSPETLKQSFAELMTTMDELSRFREDALPRMSVVISEFKELAETGEAYIQRIEEGKLAIEGK